MATQEPCTALAGCSKKIKEKLKLVEKRINKKDNLRL